MMAPQPRGSKIKGENPCTRKFFTNDGPPGLSRGSILLIMTILTNCDTVT